LIITVKIITNKTRTKTNNDKFEENRKYWLGMTVTKGSREILELMYVKPKREMLLKCNQHETNHKYKSIVERILLTKGV
jgi:hypothetical protein